MFGWEYPPAHLGGLGVACQGLVRGLLQHGAKVTLVLPQGDAEADPGMSVISPTEQHVQTVRVKSMLQPYDSFANYANRLRNDAIPRSGIALYGRDLGEAVHTFTELSVELTKDVKADVIHSHDWMTFGAGARAARYHRIPFVAHVHATELDRTHFRPNEWIYWREREGLERSDHIITVSNYTKQILVREYGIPGDKIDVVHNGTHDTPQFAPITTLREKHPMVLFLGRLTVQKGPFHFLEAARIVHHHRPDVQFVVAGEGYLLPELVDRACNMGLQSSVMFAGKVNGAEARELYKHASCFVMPSTSEPFGLVALEAIAQGAPVILSKQSGVAEVIPHAFHVDFWDIDKIADCIATVLREEPLAVQLRSEAPHTLQRLQWGNQAEKVISIYDKVRMRS
jgi:glycosyltransferase involved in cell wall biosynthesis